MSNDIISLSILGIVLVVAVLSLALWRWILSSHEDDTLHVLSDSSVIHHQEVMSHKLDLIDNWGRVLTIVTVVYLIFLFAMYVNQYWNRVSNMSIW